MQALQYLLPHVPMLGKGSVILDRLDSSGIITGGFHLGNVTKCSHEAKDDTAELFGSVNATSSLIASALKKRETKVTITGTDFSSLVQALVQMTGGKTVLSVSAATVTAEVLVPATAKHAGRYYQAANKNTDPSGTAPVLTNNSNVLVAGTDYVLVDPVQSIYYFPPGTTAADTHATTVTYHTLVGAFDQLAGLTLPRIQAKVLFSPDPTDGAKISRVYHKVNFSPSGATDLIGDDYASWTIEGLLLDDSANHPNDPFFIDTYVS